MLTAVELSQRLLRFTRERLADPDVAPSITPDTRLFEDRVIDSLKVLELIAFLQSTLGRKIPDAQIVLSNFRSIATIAQVFTGEAPLATRRRLRGAESRIESSPAVAELMARGEMQLTPNGGLQLRGSMQALLEYFDSSARAWAVELGAIEQTYPDQISLAALERAGFTSAFPQKLVRIRDSARPPAVCYHHYPSFAGAIVQGRGSLVTAVGRCYRNEFDPRATNPAERLAEFTMREIIAIGDGEFVEQLRSNLMERISRWLNELDLDGFIETANDPFFTSESRGRMLMQQVLPLKYELRLRADATGRTIAAASFNNHQEHFGRAFAIRLASGEQATSGCVAFGWERWVVAFVNQHGPDESGWPETVRGRDVAATA
jgi:acyl carrier protein